MHTHSDRHTYIQHGPHRQSEEYTENHDQRAIVKPKQTTRTTANVRTTQPGQNSQLRPQRRPQPHTYTRDHKSNHGHPGMARTTQKRGRLSCTPGLSWVVYPLNRGCLCTGVPHGEIWLGLDSQKNMMKMNKSATGTTLNNLCNDEDIVSLLLRLI